MKKSYDDFHHRLKLLGFKSYADYLKSTHWKNTKRRLWFLKKKKVCYCCGIGWKKKRLSWHHVRYNNLGRETLRDLVLVCDRCHKEAHTHKGLYTGIERVRKKRHPFNRSWMTWLGFVVVLI